MYDTEFAEAFKEEIELDEMKWAVGGVYHQEFKNGDKTYFRADSVQKNKRWKGKSVDEIGGKQKKPKNNTADEKTQGWETTPKNEIPKGLKEEVEIEEGKFKKGDIVIPDMGPHKGEKHKIIHDFKDGSYNINFTMDLVEKDMTLFNDLSKKLNIPLEISPLVLDIFKDAHKKYGSRSWSSMVVKRLEDNCKINFREKGFPDEIIDNEPEEKGYAI